MYTIEKLYQSQRFQLVEVRVSGKKQTAGVLCFRGSPSKLDRTGKVVCAIEDGVVVTSERCYDPGSREFRRGRIVEIAGANGIVIAYGRLASANVREGDVVRAGYTKEQNGLAQSWQGETVFCNPPYGRNVGEWVKKAHDEHAKGDCTIVMLLFARTDTKWFHDYVLGKAEVRFVRGRLKFGDEKNPAPTPSIVVIYRRRKDGAVD